MVLILPDGLLIVAGGHVPLHAGSAGEREPAVSLAGLHLAASSADDVVAEQPERLAHVVHHVVGRAAPAAPEIEAGPRHGVEPVVSALQRPLVVVARAVPERLQIVPPFLELHDDVDASSIRLVPVELPDDVVGIGVHGELRRPRERPRFTVRRGEEHVEVDFTEADRRAALDILQPIPGGVARLLVCPGLTLIHAGWIQGDPRSGIDEAMNRDEEADVEARLRQFVDAEAHIAGPRCADVRGKGVDQLVVGRHEGRVDQRQCEGRRAVR